MPGEGVPFPEAGGYTAHFHIGFPMKICMISEAESIHTQRWANTFQKMRGQYICIGDATGGIIEKP